MTDYADLVNRLRTAMERGWIDKEPIDAIEALVEELKSLRLVDLNQLDAEIARREAAEAEVAALKAQQKADDEHALKTANALKVFVDENAKLKEALTKIADSDNWPGNVAMRALEGK